MSSKNKIKAERFLFMTGRERRKFPERETRGKTTGLSTPSVTPYPKAQGMKQTQSLTTNPQGFQSNYESQKKIKQPLFFLILKRMDRNKGGKHQTKKQ